MMPLDVTKATQPQYKHMQTYYKHTWYKVEDFENKSRMDSEEKH